MMIGNRSRNIAGIIFIPLIALAGCGGGGGGGGGGSTPPVTYTISGTISGYSGSGLVLKNNSTTLAVNAGSTTFSFSGVANNSTYSITIATPPSNPVQSCSVISGSGTVNNADVTNVQVICATTTYRISGSVSGLSGTGLVLQNNGSDDLSVNTSNFTFSTPVANGSPYNVTVLAQPSGQTCTVTNGSGTVSTENITNVHVNCISNSPPPPTNYTIGGTISGLTGNGLVLRNNGVDNLALNPNSAVSTFTFNTAIANGSPYSVAVYTQPTGQICSVTNGSGTVAGVNITNIQISCADVPTYTIGGTVSGLTGSGLVLQNNGGNNRTISSDGAFNFSTGLVNGSSYNVTVLTQPSGQTCSVTYGSGTVASANVTNVQVNCVTNTYSISGIVSGLNGSGLVLQNNGSNNLTIGANGAFTFSSPIASGYTYSVTVLTQPTGQTCNVTNSSGTVVSAPVTNVQVSCANNPTYTIGGTISGLSATGLVLQNNGGDNRIIAVSDTSFTFGTAIASGNTYNVTVLTHPSGQACTVINGSGTVSSANITNVNISCVTPDYTVGGSVSGLTGTGLVLQNNGGNNRAISGDGLFTFTTPLPDLSLYSVTVLTQPTGQTCTITGGSGTVTGADVTNIQVVCVNTPSYTIGGTLSGLNGTGLVLQNNGSDNRTIAASDTSFTFSTAIKSGNPYSVTVFTQPTGQTCSVTSGSGTVANSNITNVQVNCVTNSYSISGSVSGLTSSGLVLQNNLSDNRLISANGSFAFNTAIASGAAYSVTVLIQPSGQTCTVANGSGTVTNSNITNIQVNCVNNTYTISGNVTGPLNGDPLPGTLIMQNNGTDNLSLSTYGFFTFPINVAHGEPYNVTILQQPDSVWSCIPYRSSGTVNAANVSDVLVSCVGNATISTGSMTTTRRAHSATRLDDGRVLVTGGWNTNRDTPLANALIFDQATDSFIATGSMGNARTGHTSTPLADGKVLIAGGEDKDNSGNLSSAEIFDPGINAGVGGFTTTGSMNTVRVYHSATLLEDGNVLITGGYGGTGSTIASAEIYDTNSGTFSYTTGSMSWNRIYHTATLLNDGTVLISGGQDGFPFAEIYNPGTKTFSTTGEMSASRHRHTATLLSDGKVLVVGGAQDGEFGNPIASAEIYDPATGTFHPTGGMSIPRADHTATLLSNGKVLITGGRSINGDSGALATTEIYDPASGLFINAGAMGSARTDHTATLLLSPPLNPRVLITGGFDGATTIGTAELFVPQ
jgi:hypothetical protein